MNESWNALGHLISYMDARWRRDTLEAILRRSYSMLDVEAKHLIYAELLYLDAEKYKMIVGGVGREVARRQISNEYALEVRRMDYLRLKLMMHNLVEVETIGQMKTMAQLKRDYGWDVEVVIGCDSDEVKGQIQEVANNSLIPIQEANIKQQSFDSYKPKSPQKITFDDRRAPQDESLPPWFRRDESLPPWFRSGMRVDAPTKATRVDAPTKATEIDDEMIWEGIKTKENTAEAMEEDDEDEDVDWEEG